MFGRTVETQEIVIVPVVLPLLEIIVVPGSLSESGDESKLPSSTLYYVTGAVPVKKLILHRRGRRIACDPYETVAVVLVDGPVVQSYIVVVVPVEIDLDVVGNAGFINNVRSHVETEIEFFIIICDIQVDVFHVLSYGMRSEIAVPVGGVSVYGNGIGPVNPICPVKRSFS